jgi:hypothetical protein
MERRSSWFHIPTVDTDPREALRWVRHVEILTGVLSIAVGIEMWSDGWWHWILIAGGVVGISPWPGVRQTLRRAERDPGILTADREVRLRRRRRVLPWLAVAQILLGGGFAYLIGGLGAAITTAVLGSIGVAVAAWLMVRSDRKA